MSRVTEAVAPETPDQEVLAHHRNAAWAIAFVGALGLVHAAVFTWVLPEHQFFITPPAMAGISLVYFAIAAGLSLPSRALPA